MNLCVLLLMALAFTRITFVVGGHVLAIEPHGSKSHWQYMSSILDVVAERHRVTVITPLPTGQRRSNYREIDASHVFPVYGERVALDMIRDYGSVFSMLPPWPARSHERDICDAFYEMEPVKRLLARAPRQAIEGASTTADPAAAAVDAHRSGASAVDYYDDDDDIGPVDAIVVEPFYSPCLSYLARRLRVPEAYTVPAYLAGTPMEMRMFGVESNPASVPHQLYNGSRIQTLADRLTNIGLHVYVKFVPWLTDLRMKYAEPRMYDTDGLRHDPVVVFVNTHNVVESPRPMMDNMVRVGGVHLKPPKPLPKDILEFIEDSPDGVIYVSFGSVASMSPLPPEIYDAFMGTFENLPQRVLWKFDDTNYTLPSNIMAKNWFPQRDILLHPNVKLFISHGGISGIYEAVDAGVPILGFPLFYDQPRNVGHLVDSGMALSMNFLTVHKEALWNNVNEMLHNKSYYNNAQRISEEFKRRLVTPAQQIDFWFEYMLRLNKTYGFDSACRQLSWYEYHLMDILYLILPFLLIVMVSIFIRNKTKHLKLLTRVIKI